MDEKLKKFAKELLKKSLQADKKRNEALELAERRYRKAGEEYDKARKKAQAEWEEAMRKLGRNGK